MWGSFDYEELYHWTNPCTNRSYFKTHSCLTYNIFYIQGLQVFVEQESLWIQFRVSLFYPWCYSYIYESINIIILFHLTSFYHINNFFENLLLPFTGKILGTRPRNLNWWMSGYCSIRSIPSEKWDTGAIINVSELCLWSDGSKGTIGEGNNVHLPAMEELQN